MNYFYAPSIESETNVLDRENSKHCIKVMRKRHGDIIHLIDGKGGVYEAKITDDDIHSCSYEIISKDERLTGRPYKLHILIAPTKNNSRLEWFLEKATEIGVDEITPIICENSEREKLNMDRLEKILVGAMKQSLGVFLPILNSPIQLKALFEDGKRLQGQLLAGYCEGERKHLSESYIKGENVCVFIGPEGDFSTNEIALFIENNVQSISLGASRLRTETAGVEVCSNIKLLNVIL